jgi:NAD(P)-dependent dehydrogenase (short-subunit alcohol dehydrogenase family)
MSVTRRRPTSWSARWYPSSAAWIYWSATPGSSTSALETITQAGFDRLFQTNLAGQLFATQAAAAAMTDGGRIVLSSSVSVRLTVYQHALYAASKAAISAMVRNLAPELAERNIAINAIAPGATATRMANRYSANYTHLHSPMYRLTRSSAR